MNEAEKILSRLSAAAELLTDEQRSAVLDALRRSSTRKSRDALDSKISWALSRRHVPSPAALGGASVTPRWVGYWNPQHVSVG